MVTSEPRSVHPTVLPRATRAHVATSHPAALPFLPVRLRLVSRRVKGRSSARPRATASERRMKDGTGLSRYGVGMKIDMLPRE